MKTLVLVVCMLGALLLAGCTRHDIHLKVDPIFITMDVNIKVQREIGSIFDEIDAETEALAKTDDKTPEKN